MRAFMLARCRSCPAALLVARLCSRAMASNAVGALGEDGFLASFYQPGLRLRLALVRHGESMNNVHEANGTYKTGRVADPDLSPRGYRQSALLGAFLADPSKAAFLGLDPVHELWVSPHKRTLLTVAPAAEKLGLAPLVETDLFEAGGIYDANERYDAFVARGGMTRAEMAAAHPTYVLPDDVTDDGWYKGAPAGRETDDECRARAKGVLARVRAAAAALTDRKTVVAVCHYDFIAAFLDAVAVPETTGAFARWRHHNTAVTVLDVAAATGDVTFVKVNEAAHIYEAGEPELLSGFPL